ncbi:MAG: UDP-N-acetylglucosamine--N-acetylmuramyl-(pentapeptide) pyrophosphoryl-undecaprenol N-acetylglucosamine transferase [Brevinematia bacterium]
MKICIVSGGTGGHISPGISIYKELKKRENEVIFITNPHALKFPLVTDWVKSDDIVVIPISQGFSKKKPISNLKVVKEFIQSTFISLKVLKSFQPDVVVLTGGYVSGPVGKAALLLGKKIVLLEQNSVMGLTNSILSMFATRVILTFPLKNKRVSSKFIRLGNPIRYSEEDIVIKDTAKSYFGFSSEDRVLGIILGSQGAKKVNEFLLNYIEAIAENYKIIWITGNDYYQEILEKCKCDNVKVFPFFSDINMFMSAADVVITRGGASTLSEIAFFGVPSIIIPFPYAAKNHQYHNAMFFEIHGAGIIIEEKELTIEKLLGTIEFVFKNYKIFKANVNQLFPKNILSEIVRVLESI